MFIFKITQFNLLFKPDWIQARVGVISAVTCTIQKGMFIIF